MLALGDVNRLTQAPRLPLLAGAIGLLWRRARATMSCRCSAGCTNNLVKHCCEDAPMGESALLLHPPTGPASIIITTD